MDVRRVTATGLERHAAEELPALLARGDGLIWVDIPRCDEAAVAVLRDVFGFHPIAVRACAERNRVPRVHAYGDHVFVVLHTPERGAAGHVHYIELDQFIGPGYVVTVHGPLNPAVAPEVALRETEEVARRIEAGRLRPTTPYQLAHVIVSTLARHQEQFIEESTLDVWRIEQRVTAGHRDDPERFLEEMFRARHGLVAVRTMAALGSEVWGRIISLERFVPADDRPLVADVVDQFQRVRSLAEGERDYLQGVIEFYRARTETQRTIAAERLAVIAVVTLPVTAVSSVIGMNLIVNDSTQVGLLLVVLALMATMSGLLLWWAKEQGWW